MAPWDNVASVTICILLWSHVLQQAEAHPNCINDASPSRNVKPRFCPSFDQGFCCDPAQEADIQRQYSAADATGRCAAMLKEVLCTTCHPWSGHLYERLKTGLSMTTEFCEDFYAACSSQLGLPTEYCDIHAGGYWKYPLEDDTISGKLVKAFPRLGATALPALPIDMRMTPDGSRWWVAGQGGEIREVEVARAIRSTQVLDIAGKIELSFEQGLLSFAFSPAFHETGVFFVSYTPKPRPGSFPYNRLSRFTYKSSTALRTHLTENEILFSSAKASDVHSAGWIGFKPSAYNYPPPEKFHELYWSMGDSGPQLDATLQAQNPNTLHGSIIRISVDSKSRTPYGIPNGNPFKYGGGLPEICAQGFRNPWRCSFDRANDDLYCGDVGNFEMESIKKVECGKNYGWRQFEGHRCTREIENVKKPPYEFPTGCADPNSRNTYTFPEFSYCHPDYDPDSEPAFVLPDVSDKFCGAKIRDEYTVGGTAVIGGYVYRGLKYSDLLGGNYVFADHSEKNLFHIYPRRNGWGTAKSAKYGYGRIYDDKKDFNVKVASFAEDNDGELYIIQWNKGQIFEFSCGDRCNGDDVHEVPTPPGPVPALPTPELKVRTCSNGIPGIEDGNANGVACCPLTCRVCGGRGCDERPGGKSACCIGQIIMEGQGNNCASKREAPCFIDDATPARPAPAPITSAPPDELEVPTCSNGIPGIEGGNVNGAACCPLTCTNRAGKPQCGGRACGKLPGGAKSCCVHTIKTKGQSCASKLEAPCFIDDATPARPAPAPITSAPPDELEVPTCSNGIPGIEGGNVNGAACCPLTCTNRAGKPQCGGRACGKLPGGAKSCCVHTIKTKGQSCESKREAPCFIDTKSFPQREGDFFELGCASDPYLGKNEPRVMEFGPFEPEGGPAAMSAECFCDDVDFSAELGHGGCDVGCAGNRQETCGGEYALTVYQVGGPKPVNPKPIKKAYFELGCALDRYRGDHNPRVMEFGPAIRPAAMSAEICFDICTKKFPRFSFFGTQWGMECFCAEDFSAKLDYGGCDTDCAGNRRETCGGVNALTVYQVGEP